MQPARLLYDKQGAAEMLSTSERRIDELRRAGHLLAVQDGREYKYRHDDLCAYADSLPSAEPVGGRRPSEVVESAPPVGVAIAATPTGPDSPWMTVKKAAKRAAVSEWTIREAVKSGELQSYAVGKSGRSYRLTAEDIDAWMKSRPWEQR